MPLTQANRILAIKTALGDDVLVVRSIGVQEQISRLFQIEAELSSEDGSVDFDKVVGNNVTIRLEIGTGSTRYFNGFVSRMVQLAGHGGYAHYHATIVPWLWFLTRTSDCRPWVAVEDPSKGKTVPEIIEAVFKLHGFNDYKLSLTGTYPKREFCVQYRETDFNFVSRLMEQEGIHYFFEHVDGKHTLVLADSASANKPFPGYEEIIFHELQKGAASREVVTEWTIENEVQPVAYAINDFNFQKPKTALLSNSNVTRQHGAAQFEMYDYPGEYVEHGDGDRLAKVRIEELQTQFETLRGQSSAHGIAAGHTFTLKSHPRKDQNREYLVTAAALHADAGEYGSVNSGGGDFFSCNFTVIDAKQTYRPPRLTPKPIVQGPQTAMVVGPGNEEIYTDKYGRVKVMFHWDRYAKADENSSCWIRVSQEWAGKKWGAIYLPRIGQEVIVEFLEGDPDRPLITGRVYNAETMPPYDLPAEKTKSTLKSNSSKGGNGFNEIRFEDKAKSEQIFIHAQHDLDVRVRNDMKETNYGNRHERIGWKTDGGSGGSHFVLVHEDENVHVEKKHYEMVDDDSHLTVKGEVTETHKKSHKVSIAASHVINANETIVETAMQISLKTAQISAQGANGVYLLGKEIILEGDSICLKSGGNFISVNSSGVQIKGSAVMINSGGSATSAKQPAALPDISVLQPLDASLATDAKTGGNVRYSGTPVQRAGGPVTPIKAPPYTPPPATPGPVAPGGGRGAIVVPPVTTCGGPYEMRDKESRKANDQFILEVVPTSLMSGDTITLKSQKGCSCAGALVVVGDRNTNLNAPAKVDGWSVSEADSGGGADPDLQFGLITTLGLVTPRTMNVQLACGQDKSTLKSGEIHVYPSDTIAIKAELHKIVDKLPGAAAMIKGLAGTLTTITGKNVDPYEGIKFSAGLGLVIVGPPQLTLGYDAQWKEYKAGTAEEWQAYYAWKASLGLTISIEFKLDVLAVAAAGTGVGVPIVELANRVKDAIGQEEPLIYLGLKAEMSGTGSGGYEESAFGSIEIKGTGSVSIGAIISVPDVVEASAEASTGVSATLTGKISKPGLEATYELFKWDGVQGKASVKISVGKLFTVGFEHSAQLIDGHEALIKGNLLP